MMSVRSAAEEDVVEMPVDPLVRSLFLAEDPVCADLAIAFGSSDLLEAKRCADRAAQLYRDGYVSRVLFSGGDPAGRGRSDAAVMTDAAAQCGLPRDARLVEDRSNSTAENVLNCRRVLAEYGRPATLAFGPGVR